MFSIFEMMIFSLSSVIQDSDDVPWSLSMFELKFSNNTALINANQVPCSSSGTWSTFWREYKTNILK